MTISQTNERTSLKSKRSLTYNEMSQFMRLYNTDPSEIDADETILYSESDISDNSENESNDVHSAEKIAACSDEDARTLTEAIDRLCEHNLDNELITFLKLVFVKENFL